MPAPQPGVLEDLPEPSTALIDTSFPKGAALADWLQLNQASSPQAKALEFMFFDLSACVQPDNRVPVPPPPPHR
jgi:hypothetical protein